MQQLSSAAEIGRSSDLARPTPSVGRKEPLLTVVPNAPAISRNTQAAPVESDLVAEVMQRERIYRRLLALGDGPASMAAVCITVWISGLRLTPAALAIPVLMIFVAKVQGLYDRDDLLVRKSTSTELKGLMLTAAVLVVGLHFANHLLMGGASSFAFSCILWSLALALLLLARMAARRVAVRAAPLERCLIVGDSERSAALAANLRSLDGVTVIGTVSADEIGCSTVSDLISLVEQLQIHRLIVAPDRQVSEETTLGLVRSAKAIGVRVSLFPTLMAAVGGSLVVDDLGAYTLLGVPRFGLSRSSSAVKRAFDIAGAAFLLVILAPALAGIAVMIKMDSRGPVLFRQTRVGRRGQQFRILKFRSMVDNADALKADLLRLNEADGGLFKIANDPRVTSAGRWLRRTRLDEVPQLWNVLRGEMSLVGPRPLIVDEDSMIDGVDRYRLHLTPGMTGPWQVLGPLRVPLTEMAKLDYLYIANWSLWKDLEILFQTALLVLDRQGI